MRDNQVAVLGAGIAGLTAANWLHRNGIPSTVYEAGKQIAGLAATFQEDGFTYDFGAHFITSRLAREIGVEDQCRIVKYYGESVYLGGRHYSYPIGLLFNPRFLAGGVASLAPSARKHGGAQNLAEHFVSLYGRPLAEEVAIPLVEAWSGAPARELAASVAQKIPLGVATTLFLKLFSRVRKRAIAIGYGKEKRASVKVWHVYPNGGTALLCQKLAEPLRERVRTGARVEAIHVEDGRVSGIRVNGEFQPAQIVINTAPCNVLAKLIQGSAALNYLSQFRFRAMVFVNLRLRGRGLLKDTVIWLPEHNFPFFRLTETPISMPWMAPEGKTLITADLGCERGDELWVKTEEELASLCLDKMEALIPDVRDRYLGVNVLRTPYAYPVFLSRYEDQRVHFQQDTGIDSLYSIGRNGEFNHLLTEDVYWRTLAKMPQIKKELLARAAENRSAHSQGM